MLLLSFCLICLLFRYKIIFNSEQILNDHWYLKNVFFKFTNLYVSVTLEDFKLKCNHFRKNFH